MTADLIPITGAPASPYTRKMLAVLRYRRIPYRFVQNKRDSELQKPKVGLIPIVYFRNQTGSLEPEIDSTPIIRRLEAEFPRRSVIPQNPVTAFLNYLIEDYGDEWLTKAMFHYRWAYPEDVDMAGSILPFYQAGISQSDHQAKELKKIFSERQISRLYVVGSNEITREVIEGSFKRFLSSLNKMLMAHPFLLGNNPSSCDFSCYGQLTQLAHFDPTPSQIVIDNFPRIHAWISVMDDLSGIEDNDEGFLSPDQLSSRLAELLSEIGETYAPVMLANAQSIDEGKSEVETLVKGKKWTQEPFPYQAKCLHWLRVEHSKLGQEDREKLANILEGSGCEKLIKRKS